MVFSIRIGNTCFKSLQCNNSEHLVENVIGSAKAGTARKVNAKITIMQDGENNTVLWEFIKTYNNWYSKLSNHNNLNLHENNWKIPFMFLCCNDKCTKRVVLILKELEIKHWKIIKKLLKKLLISLNEIPTWRNWFDFVMYFLKKCENKNRVLSSV